VVWEIDLASHDQNNGRNNNDIGAATTLHKLYQIMAKIQSSNLLWEALQEDAQQKQVNWLVPVLDVRVF